MKDNQHEQLFTELLAEFETSAFTELDDEIAANCSGGVAYLYQHDNFQGRRLQFFDRESDLRDWNFNDQTSSIKIEGSEKWTFYKDIQYKTNPVTLASGSYTLKDLQAKGIPNDSISSLKRVG
jgi:hypothetical protein